MYYAIKKLPKFILCTFAVFYFLLIVAPKIFAWPGVIVHVADGDTMRIRPDYSLDNEKGITIRLYGVDSPEKKQSFGARIAKAAGEEMLGLHVEVKEHAYDRYGRTVAMIYLPSGLSVQEYLIEAGFAWVYPNYCKIVECVNWEKMQEAARIAKRGLWEENNPTPPWQWRKIIKAEHSLIKN